MNCHLHAEAIGDLARDVVVHTDIAAAARAHLAECAACTTQFERQRELTAGLRALAAATAAARPSELLRQRLMDGYAAHHGSSAATHGKHQRASRGALSAAAVLALAAALGWMWRTVPERPRTAQPAAALVAHAPAPVAPPVVTAPVGSRPASRTRPSRNRRPPQPAVVEEFIAVPGSSALPELESGQIVRVQLPLTALPVYGVEIAPDAVRSDVAADLLVGQDGHTRAIRLVR